VAFYGSPSASVYDKSLQNADRPSGPSILSITCGCYGVELCGRWNNRPARCSVRFFDCVFFDPSLTDQISEIALDFLLREAMARLQFALDMAYFDGRALLASTVPTQQQGGTAVADQPEGRVSKASPRPRWGSGLLDLFGPAQILNLIHSTEDSWRREWDSNARPNVV